MKFPEIIAEAGINHNGNLMRALLLLYGAVDAGADTIKFQCHIPDKEMSYHAKNVVPGNSSQDIYSIIEKATLTESMEQYVFDETKKCGIQYLSTPFSVEAADRLNKMGVEMFKIGSGEANNYPFIEYVNSLGKPIILSTGMSDMKSIEKAVKCLTVPFALMHCVSIYPTPFNRMHLQSINQLKKAFGCPVGLSDHSLGVHVSLAAIGMGADIIEKHFTLNKAWEGPDNKISLNFSELALLVTWNKQIREAMQGGKEILPDEQVTIAFANSSIVTIRDIKKGETLTRENIWIKRPAGGLPPVDFETVLGLTAKTDIPNDTQLERDFINEQT